MKKHIPSFSSASGRYWSTCTCGYNKTQDDTPQGRQYVQEDMAAHCKDNLLSRIKQESPPPKCHDCGKALQEVVEGLGLYCRNPDCPNCWEPRQLHVSKLLNDSINIVAEKGIWKDVPDAAEYIRNKRSSC